MGLTNFEQMLVDSNGNPYGVSGSMALPVGAIGQLIATVNPNTNVVEYLNSVSGSLQITGSVTSQVTFPSSLGVFPTSPSGFWFTGGTQVSGAVNISNWPATIGVSASVQLPVYSTGPVGVTASAQIPVFNTGLVGVSGTVSVVQPVQVWTEGPIAVSGAIHTGSTANGFPVTVGGVYYGSGNVGSLPAYVQSIQVDPSGSVYVTTSGTLPVVLTDNSTVSVANFPANQQVWTEGPVGVTGSVSVTTSGPLQVWTEGAFGVSASMQLPVYSTGPVGVSGTVGAVIENWPATFGVSASVQLPVFNTGPVGVSGTVSVAQPVEVWQQSTVGISGSWTSGSVAVAPIMPVLEAGLDRNNIVRPILTDPQGRITNPTTGSNVTSIASSLSNQQALAPNANRVGATFWNEGSANAYVKLGVGASKTSYTVFLGQKAYWEMPFTFQGEIDVIFDGTTGNLRVTELF